MNPRRVVATARRVLSQLRRDPRTVALLVVVPCVLMTLLRFVFDGRPAVFDRLAPMLLALFPFTVMFVVTSVAMLRERTSGTLERVLTTPGTKAELLTGYGLAFGAAAVVQAGLALATSLGPLGLHVDGSVGLLAVISVLDALAGMALGLFLSAFAHSEFQAVQFLPAVVLPQLLVSGLLSPRDQMVGVLRWMSEVFPLSYAVDGASRAAAFSGWSSTMVTDVIVVGACIPLALALGAATLRRRTP